MLMLRRTVHMRVLGGAVLGYEITDCGKLVGNKSVQINKRTRPWTFTVKYILGDREYPTIAEWKAAYARSADANQS